MKINETEIQLIVKNVLELLASKATQIDKDKKNGCHVDSENSQNSYSVLNQIKVPSAKKNDETYSITILNREYSFVGLKQLLGFADISKAGDRVAGLSAPNEATREAARSILSDLTIQYMYDNPLTDKNGHVDSIMKVNYDIDLNSFSDIKHLTLGELKDKLLSSNPKQIRYIGQGLTGVMVAAITKLLDVHEMIFIARKLKIGASTKARTMLGLPGTLSSRLQPNHPTDNISGITMLTYLGLSMGSGDAMIGLNPANDTVENISSILNHLDNLRRETGAPTQICVLSHIKTQLQCLEAGAPVEIIFQSLAGTDATLTEEFDVTVELLDQAYETMKKKGPIKNAENFMYFETGQGSEVSYDKHNGIDMATTEALCYGLARRYKPFMVNNVTGFIGPETHLDNFEMIYSCLQDHLMGKLLGLPMGMAPCFTLHSKVTSEGQQIATELLTAAGCNFYMDVYLNTDRMLSYFDTSAHDDQTLREIHNLKPSPEYLRWCISKGIFEEDQNGNITRGPNWGNPRIFCSSDSEFQRLKESIPASYGTDNAGSRPSNRVTRLVKSNQAIAREAIYAELREQELGGIALRILATGAFDKDAHLGNPELGSHLSQKTLQQLNPENKDIQIVISDGLSAEAIHHNIPELLPVLMDGLQALNFSIGQPILSPLGRVKLAESVGNALHSKITLLLIGERPGGDALASRSMSAYLVYRLDDVATRQAAIKYSGNNEICYETTVISNIYSAGLPPLEAGAVIIEKIVEILKMKAAGNRLESLRQ